MKIRPKKLVHSVKSTLSMMIAMGLIGLSIGLRIAVDFPNLIDHSGAILSFFLIPIAMCFLLLGNHLRLRDSKEK